MNEQSPIKNPNSLLSYFRAEWAPLLIVTITGLLYNVGLLAGPWFEGRLAQCLLDIFSGRKSFPDMLYLVFTYVLVTGGVQGARTLKRFYVRRFGNHINRNMKQILYGNLIHHSKAELESENIGNIITKAISDVDACAEGMRKFTTEIFDTGVVMLGYMALLMVYDVRLALLSMLFPPISYLLAEKMKKVVQKSNAAAQESRGHLNTATLDRVSNADTYRIFGCETQRNSAYEENLDDYEKKTVRANIWVAAMPPLYQIISMVSVLFIIYFGAQNVVGKGWTAWDIAAFTTFLSCYIKLSVKSSKAAKLFNAVQKAEVSWKRIKPLMQPVPAEEENEPFAPQTLTVCNLGMAYSDAAPVFSDLSFTAKPGEIIGVTGSIACGKSTLGRAFLCEHPYLGSILFGNKELKTFTSNQLSGIVGYLGHDPELQSMSIEENIVLGDREDITPLLKTVCMEHEVESQTVVGSDGVRLSGGQKARLALARTLAHSRPLLILDDPFSALDKKTEEEIFENLRIMAKDSIVLLLSHRLNLFPQFEKIIWMENGRTTVGTHSELMAKCPSYADLYKRQEGGGFNAEKAE